jgi:hypothetical protein
MPFERELAEAYTAEGELAKISAAAAAPAAAVMNARGENVQIHPRGPGLLDLLLAGRAVLLLDSPSGVLQGPLQLVSFIY